MGLPYRDQHAGEIFFGPKDGYLYLTVGHGGNSTHGDPWNFAQKKKSLLGKVLRLDINHFPSEYTWKKDLHFCLFFSFLKEFIFVLLVLIFFFWFTYWLKETN